MSKNESREKWSAVKKDKLCLLFRGWSLPERCLRKAKLRIQNCDKDHHKLCHGQKKNDLTQSDITIRQDGKKQLGSKSS